LEGFFNEAVEMGSDAVIYITNFIKIGSGVQKLIGVGGYTDTHTHIHTHGQQRDLITY
jgi:hypothetical protein